MESEDSDVEYEAIMRMIIRRRPRIYRERRNFFTSYDEPDFRFRFRMCKEAAYMILELIRLKIQHRTKRSRSVSPEEMFLLTLRYFATGCMQRSCGDLSGVSVSTASRTIRRVCHHIAMLADRFIGFPLTADGQRDLQREFYRVAKFPRVVAAMDCTHIKIISPGGEDAELFRNRKGYFSLNVQTLCDSKLNFLDIVCRWPGSTHDATILRNSRIFCRFEANEFGNSIVVADSGYPCNRWIMTPLSKVTTPVEGLYNESQIRTRNPVERSYGVWKRRFPVLSLGIRMDIEQVEGIVVATAVLHNICNLKNDSSAPPISGDINFVEAEINCPALSTSGDTDNFYRRQIICNHFANL